MTDDTPHTDDFFVSDDRKLLDMGFVVSELMTSPWGAWLTSDIITTSMMNSQNFGLYYHGEGSFTRQVGFARVVSDRATFHYLCDVVVASPFRGRRLGDFLCRTIIGMPQFKTGQWLLRTRTAEGFYTKLGFETVTAMRRVTGPLAGQPR